MKKIKEKDIQKQIKDYLEYKGWLVVKFNNVGIYKKETGQYIPPSQKGISDLLCCSPMGRFIAIEVKTHGGKMSPYQVIFQEQVIRNKGIAIMANCLEDIEALVKGV